MPTLKKYSLSGQEVGEVNLPDAIVDQTANTQMIKDYLVALRANQRQWNAHTKTRPEVNHSGQKPHPQKGTGRARQGYLGATQYKGGGRVHSPRSKVDQHVRINKKERQAAVRHLFADKIRSGRIHVLQYEPLSAPKTKTFASFLDGRDLLNKRVLILGEEGAENFQAYQQSIRNIPKVEFMRVPHVSGYDVVVTHDVIVLDTAIDQLMKLLGA